MSLSMFAWINKVRRSRPADLLSPARIARFFSLMSSMPILSMVARAASVFLCLSSGINFKIGNLVLRNPKKRPCCVVEKIALNASLSSLDSFFRASKR